MSTTTEQSTKIIIGPVRLSFVTIWEPKAIKGSKEKYSVSLLIPKSNKKMVTEIENAIKAAKEAGKAKWGGKIPGKLEISFKDGDVEKPDAEEYADHFFISAKSSTKPGVVDKNRKPIIDQEEVYSGCWGYVSVNFYPYDSDGNKGVAAGLQNIMKWKDGEAFAGRVSAEEDFANLELAVDEDLLD